jgi:hypothetical protein
MAAFTMIESVIVIRISRQRRAVPLPWFVKQTLAGWLGKLLVLGPLPSVRSRLIKMWTNLSILLCVPHSSQMQRTVLNSIGEEMTDHINDERDEQPIISSQDSSSESVSHREWLMLASAVDRIFFCVYFLVFILMAIFCHL